MILQPGHFDDFFEALWEQAPFPWQRRLAQQVHSGTWPSIIDLPTGSGKTACLDVAVFTLALQASLPPTQRTAGRRIVFAVNRRIIVDEAFIRASHIARKLADPEAAPVLRAVASALARISGDAQAPPLDVAILRGGIYRDNRWARSITQPTIITSTIDQVGSRLLFRGYGISDSARPLHAALLAHDCTILLDEAHLNRAFQQTLDAVQLYRSPRWGQQPVSTPFAVVHMTATPGQNASDAFRLDNDDRKHPVLKKRTSAAKRTMLRVAAKAKGQSAKWLPELAATLAQQARQFASENCQTVAIVVNRVATAREVFRLLSQDGDSEAHLVIGRMRPWDRDQLTTRLLQLVGKDRNWAVPLSKPQFIVATQCLEAGADFDFDAMVTECASLDALRQRFGRLNRNGRDIAAPSCIVIRADQVTGDDPVYGPALCATWKWLQSIADKSDQVDFGIQAMDAALANVDITSMLPPTEHAPIMLPAYLDAWTQTSPSPMPDPDVLLFLHGPRRGEPEVQVCWRADVPDDGNVERWIDAVSLCPPTSPECMSIPLSVARQWISTPLPTDTEQSDLLDAPSPEPPGEDRPLRTALAWRGPERSQLISSPDSIQPGDTLVFSAKNGGWSVLGHALDLTNDPALAARDGFFNPWLADVADEARHRVTGRWTLRLPAQRVQRWGDDETVKQLLKWFQDEQADFGSREFKQLLAAVADVLTQGPPTTEPPPDSESEAVQDRERAGKILQSLLPRFKAERHPSGGIALQGLQRSPGTSALPPMDDGADVSSFTQRRHKVPLTDHLLHVTRKLESEVEQLSVTPWADAIKLAARMHDWGKADERFQAMLIRSHRTQAMFEPTLWAKSESISAAQRPCHRNLSELPRGFRHEMLSVQLAQAALAANAVEIEAACSFDLALHLIAAHHGYARPFAPVVFDPEPPDVSLQSINLNVAISSQDRLAHPPHRLDSGIPDRFWHFTRLLGWWGLAYLEAVLRLADQLASADEDTADQPAPAILQEATS